MRITPDKVGLPPGLRRRTRGLRREEIAVLTGISPTWYTYLEQGRDIRPSNDVLDDLARVLQLTRDERTYLYLLVSGQRPPLTGALPDAEGAESIRRTVLMYGDVEHPILGCDGYGGVIAWNAATARWYTDFGALPPEKRNLLYWQLTDPGARERLVDWDEDTRSLVSTLRIICAGRPWDVRLTELVDDLQDISPDFRRWWAEHQVSERPNRIRRLRAPDGQVSEMELLVLRPADSFNSLMVHVPMGR